MGRKGNPSALLVGMQTGAATMKTVWNLLRKLKMELPFDPAIPLLGLYPKNPQPPIQKNLCTPMFIAEQFAIVKCWKQPKCPSVNEWIKNQWQIYTMECYTAERKKELLPFVTAWMELKNIMLSEISQATGDLAHNPGMCPNWESNRQPFGSQPALNPLSYTSQDIFLLLYSNFIHLGFFFLVCHIFFKCILSK